MKRIAKLLLLAATLVTGAHTAQADGWDCGDRTCTRTEEGRTASAWVIRARDRLAHRTVYVALPSEDRCRDVRVAMLVAPNYRYLKISLCREER